MLISLAGPHYATAQQAVNANQTAPQAAPGIPAPVPPEPTAATGTSRSDNTPEISPQQRAEKSRSQSQEKRLRSLMASFGVTELEIQNAIILYIQDEVSARQPLREQGRRLYKALKDEGTENAALVAMLNDFRAAVDADKARRAASMAVLAGQTMYTANSRLEAMLLLLGLIGDGPAIVPFSAIEIRPATPRVVTDTVKPLTESSHPQAVASFFTRDQKARLLRQFDTNRDGTLDALELGEAKSFLVKEAENDLSGTQTKPLVNPTDEDKPVTRPGLSGRPVTPKESRNVKAATGVR